MVVVREDFADAALAHRQHRNAVCQTITFIGPRFVKRKAPKKNVSGVRDDLNVLIFNHITQGSGSHRAGRPPKCRAGLARCAPRSCPRATFLRLRWTTACSLLRVFPPTHVALPAGVSAPHPIRSLNCSLGVTSMRRILA